eukprot:gene5521-3982_t
MLNNNDNAYDTTQFHSLGSFSSPTVVRNITPRCDKSQCGRFEVCLQPHRVYFFDLSTEKATGCISVWCCSLYALCDASQKGCRFCGILANFIGLFGSTFVFQKLQNLEAFSIDWLAMERLRQCPT